MPTKEFFDAILFDMDGLLTNTEPLWEQTTTKVTSQFGYRWSESDHKNTIGYSFDNLAKYIWNKCNQINSPDWFLNELLESLVSSFIGEIPLMPGAEELLSQVQKAKIPFGLVTSNYRRICDLVRGTLPDIHFDVTITFEDVSKPKPDPEGYLKAAKLLGAEPKNVLIFEDSGPGVRAAAASGAKVCAVPTYPGIEESERIRVVHSLTEVNLKIIKNWYLDW